MTLGDIVDLLAELPLQELVGAWPGYSNHDTVRDENAAGLGKRMVGQRTFDV